MLHILEINDSIHAISNDTVFIGIHTHKTFNTVYSKSKWMWDDTGTYYFSIPNIELFHIVSGKLYCVLKGGKELMLLAGTDLQLKAHIDKLTSVMNNLKEK